MTRSERADHAIGTGGDDVTRSFERILIEVDPHTVHHPELDRGISIARTTGAEVGIVGVMGERDLPAGPGAHIDTTDIDEFHTPDRDDRRTARCQHLDQGAVRIGGGSAGRGSPPLGRRPDRAIAPRVSPYPSCDVERDLIRASPAPVLLVASRVAASCPLVLKWWRRRPRGTAARR